MLLETIHRIDPIFTYCSWHLFIERPSPKAILTKALLNKQNSRNPHLYLNQNILEKTKKLNFHTSIDSLDFVTPADFHLLSFLQGTPFFMFTALQLLLLILICTHSVTKT